MTTITPAAEAAIERMDTIGLCWAAVTELLNPEPNLNAVNRDHLATLLDFLSDEYAAASKTFSNSIRPGAMPHAHSM